MPTSDAEAFNASELTSDIVAAFVSNNALPIADLPALIHSVHAALAQLASGPVNSAPLAEKKEPAVSIRKSITPDFLVCLDDGKKFKSLRRHLRGLGMTPDRISREVEPAVRLSDGRAQLRGGAIGNGKAIGVWPNAQDRRAAPEGLHRRADQAWASREGQ